MEKDKEEWINQISYQLDLYHDQLNTNGKKFENVYDELNKKFQYSRNSTLSVIAFIIPALFSLATIDHIKEVIIPNLAIGISSVIAIVISIYLFFAYHSRKKSTKYLNIKKAFHDGYTAINFMKALIINYDFINQLSSSELNSLDSFLFIIRGAIAHKIRTTIEFNTDRYLSEEQIYGKCEKKLYDYLIDNAKEMYNSINHKLLDSFLDLNTIKLFNIYNDFYISDLKEDLIKKT
jgi:hypothetical protein